MKFEVDSNSLRPGILKDDGYTVAVLESVNGQSTGPGQWLTEITIKIYDRSPSKPKSYIKDFEAL